MGGLKNKFFVLSFIFVFLLSGFIFVSAETYNGDGTYFYGENYPHDYGNFLIGDKILLDNDYVFELVDIDRAGSYGALSPYEIKIFSPKGDLVNQSTFVFGAHGDVDEKYKILNNEKEILEISFLRTVENRDGRNYETMEITLKSLGNHEKNALQGTNSNSEKENTEINPGFFSKIGNWFKCLFSKEC